VESETVPLTVTLEESAEEVQEITYDFFRTFDFGFKLGGWYKREAQGL